MDAKVSLIISRDFWVIMKRLIMYKYTQLIHQYDTLCKVKIMIFNFIKKKYF